MSARPRLIAWMDREHAGLVTDAVDEARLELVGVGSPSPTSVAELSQALGVGRIGDLRQAIQHEEADVLWLSASEPIGAAERKLIRQVGRPTITTQPLPVTVAEMRADPAEAETAHFVPLLRRAPGTLAAQDVLGHFREPRAISLLSVSGPHESTLFAQLFDTMDLIDSFGGSVETIDAALAAPRPGVPEDLSALRGCLALNLRFADRRCANVTLADGGGAWLRQLTVVGEAGCLRVTDDGFVWQVEGKTVDEHHEPEALRPGALIGRQLRRLLDGLDADPHPAPDRLLALCEAARLSCRTGQNESPRRMLEMRV